jgi:UPF0755 protein
MRKFSFLIVLLFLIIGGFFAWIIGALSAVDISNHTPKTFTINRGEGIRQIANNLKKEGLINDSVAFFLFIRQQGLDNKIQAGEFQLSPSMSANDIAKALQMGSYDTQITIPEGKRAEEIADILQDNFPQFDNSWRARLDAEEGYLFPDTYAFAKDATIDTIISTMKANFEQKYATIPNQHSKLTREQIVTIASLIEREAMHDQDRPLVASVVLNRLQINMALQIDAAVQYALGYQIAEKTWWKKNLTLADLKVNSPYNTYENPGLPPTPISNPGYKALKAVLEAPDTEYLYYVSDPATGENHYTKTFEAHAQNIKKYGLEN